ncbi:hypothetical protein D9M71_580200 [compost metagenome]
MRRPVGRTPGQLTYRATAVRQVTGRLGENAAHGIGLTHEDVRHHLIAPVFGDVLPARVSFLEKVHIALTVNRQQRLQAGIVRLNDVEAEILRRLQQIAGTFGHFLRRAQLPTGEVTARMVQELFGVKVATHELLLIRPGQHGPARH